MCGPITNSIENGKLTNMVWYGALHLYSDKDERTHIRTNRHNHFNMNEMDYFPEHISNGSAYRFKDESSQNDVRM